MIKKFILKYTIILLVNLFIFLIIGYFIDKFFNTNGLFIIIFLILSIVNLVIITQIMVKKNLSKLNNIKENIKNNIKNNGTY